MGLAGLLLSAGCASKAETSAILNCPAQTGTPWTPSVTSASPTNHRATTTLTQTVLTGTGALTGQAQAIAAGGTVSFTIDMSEDLGAYGSLTLEAEPTSFPSTLKGSAFPVLISLSDGLHEFVNLSAGCLSSGLYSCPGGSCTANSGCTVQWPSAFTDRQHWEQHQLASFGYASVNTFPTCNWTGGQDLPSKSPKCAFNTDFFGGTGKLRSGPGVVYTAKYALLTERYSSVTGYSGGMKLTVTKKKASEGGGAVDVNVILVGSRNVGASRTAKGQQNLDIMFSSLESYLNQGASSVRLGRVKAVEWDCADGGDAYANVRDAAMGSMFAAGSSYAARVGLPQAMNVFLVSSIQSSYSSFPILGMAGAIGGPTLAGSGSSGLAFSSFNKLDTFNPLCTSSTCPVSSQEESFVEMGATIAHEMGHYFGLNHPSELTGTMHDVVADTPVCTTLGASGYISISSCATDASTVPGQSSCKDVCPGYSASSGVFCPDRPECQFNHLMWWSSKNMVNGIGDGNLISDDAASIILYSPFVQ